MARSAHRRRRIDSDEDIIEDVGSSQPQRWTGQDNPDDEMEDVQDASQLSASATAGKSKNKGKEKKRAATPPSDDGSGPEADADQDLPPFDPTTFRDQPIPGRASDNFAEIFQMWQKGVTPLDILEKNIREAAIALTEAGEQGNPEVCVLICCVGFTMKDVRLRSMLVAFLTLLEQSPELFHIGTCGGRCSYAAMHRFNPVCQVSPRFDQPHPR